MNAELCVGNIFATTGVMVIHSWDDPCDLRIAMAWYLDEQGHHIPSKYGMVAKGWYHHEGMVAAHSRQYRIAIGASLSTVFRWCTDFVVVSSYPHRYHHTIGLFVRSLPKATHSRQFNRFFTAQTSCHLQSNFTRSGAVLQAIGRRGPHIIGNFIE